MLEKFGPGVWIANGPVVDGAAGFHYPTRMAVIRLADGGLAVWSPVALGETGHAAVEALGPVRFLLAPNSLHHTFLGEWQLRYPQAVACAPPGLRDKRPDIRFDADLADPDFAHLGDEIDLAVMGGNRITEEVVFFHRESGTAIFADLLQRLPRGWFTGWRGIVARLDLMSEAEPAVPRKFRLAFTDREAARRGLARILSWPVEKILIAHGEPVRGDGRAFIERAFGWLKP